MPGEQGMMRMTAERVFLISAPTVGSKLTSQTSLLCTEILAVESRKDGGDFEEGAQAFCQRPFGYAMELSHSSFQTVG